MTTLEKRVHDYVRLNPHSAALDILFALRKQRVACSKTQINSVLYTGLRRGAFVQEDPSRPRWRLPNVSLKQAQRHLKERQARRVEQAAPKPGKPVPLPRKQPKSANVPKVDVKDNFGKLYKWQREAIAAWQGNNSVGVIEAVTGTGKTMVGVVATANELRRGGQVLIVVPTIELQTQWTSKLKQLLFGDFVVGQLGGGKTADFRSSDVVIAVVNSVRLRKLKPKNGDGLLIADECHRYGARTNRTALSPLFPRRLGLTATLERDDGGHITWIIPYFHKRVFQVDYRRAKRDRIISPFRVGFVGVRFSSDEYQEFERLNSEASAQRGKLISQFGVPGEPFGEFMRHVTELCKQYGSPEGYCASAYIKAFAERQRLLAETDVKYDALESLAPAIRKATRTMVFTQTKKSAARAANTLRRAGILTEVVDSSLTRRERTARLQAYERGESSAIVAPRILDEGIDVPEADLGIILAASRSRRQMIQRMGRVIRPKQDRGHARFAVVFVENTSEDPRSGAHEAFLEELRDVAEDEQVFANNPNAALKFLRPSDHRSV